MKRRRVWGIWDKKKKFWCLVGQTFFESKKRGVNYLAILGWTENVELRSVYLPAEGYQYVIDRYNAFEPDGAVRRLLDKYDPKARGFPFDISPKEIAELKKLCGGNNETT